MHSPHAMYTMDTRMDLGIATFFQVSSISQLGLDAQVNSAQYARYSGHSLLTTIEICTSK